jgi:hypothetical protein
MDKGKGQIRWPIEPRICLGTTEIERWIRKNYVSGNDKPRVHYNNNNNNNNNNDNKD